MLPNRDDFKSNQSDIIKQFALYMSVIAPEGDKGKAQDLNKRLNMEDGICFGLSVVHGAMAQAGKLDWWKNVVKELEGWDKTEAGLNKQVTIPGSTNSNSVTLGSLFERAISYGVVNQAYLGDLELSQNFGLQGATQGNLLAKGGSFEMLVDKKDAAGEPVRNAQGQIESEVMAVQNYQDIEAKFNGESIKSLLSNEFGEQLQNRVVVISSTDSSRHAMRLSYEGDGQWMLYNPNRGEMRGNSDQLIKNIQESVGTLQLQIQVATMGVENNNKAANDANKKPDLDLAAAVVNSLAAQPEEQARVKAQIENKQEQAHKKEQAAGAARERAKADTDDQDLIAKAQAAMTASETAQPKSNLFTPPPFTVADRKIIGKQEAAQNQRLDATQQSIPKATATAASASAPSSAKPVDPKVEAPKVTTPAAQRATVTDTATPNTTTPAAQRASVTNAATPTAQPATVTKTATPAAQPATATNTTAPLSKTTAAKVTPLADIFSAPPLAPRTTAPTKAATASAQTIIYDQLPADKSAAKSRSEPVIYEQLSADKPAAKSSSEPVILTTQQKHALAGYLGDKLNADKRSASDFDLKNISVVLDKNSGKYIVGVENKKAAHLTYMVTLDQGKWDKAVNTPAVAPVSNLNDNQKQRVENAKARLQATREDKVKLSKGEITPEVATRNMQERKQQFDADRAQEQADRMQQARDNGRAKATNTTTIAPPDSKAAAPTPQAQKNSTSSAPAPKTTASAPNKANPKYYTQLHTQEIAKKYIEFMQNPPAVNGKPIFQPVKNPTLPLSSKHTLQLNFPNAKVRDAFVDANKHLLKSQRELVQQQRSEQKSRHSVRSA